MAKAKAKATTEVQEEVQETQAAQPDSISLQDLSLLANIVDLASQRGAFRGNELTQVGTMYDKLSAFLSYVAEQQEAAKEEKGQTEATAEE